MVINIWTAFSELDKHVSSVASMHTDILIATCTELWLSTGYSCSATSTAGESQDTEQAVKISLEAQQTLGQLAWAELCATVVKELLLAKLFSLKVGFTAITQAAVIYIIVQRSVSYLD